jgi:hypothetical protein
MILKKWVMRFPTFIIAIYTATAFGQGLPQRVSAIEEALTGSSPNQLVVSRVEFSISNTEAYIYGSNFDNGTPPIVKLGGIDQIVLSSGSDEITVSLLPGLVSASYLLQVKTGYEIDQNDAFEVTIGAGGLTGPAGPPGPAGNDGLDGATGPQGSGGLEGVAGPVGPEGPAGPQGPQGPIGPQGPVGLEGPFGPEGPAGPIGPQGPAGNDGQDGSISLSKVTLIETACPGTSSCRADCPIGSVVLGGGSEFTVGVADDIAEIDIYTGRQSWVVRDIGTTGVKIHKASAICLSE